MHALENETLTERRNELVLPFGLLAPNRIVPVLNTGTCIFSGKLQNIPESEKNTQKSRLFSTCCKYANLS